MRVTHTCPVFFVALLSWFFSTAVSLAWVQAAEPLPEISSKELGRKVQLAYQAYDAGLIEATYVQRRRRDDLGEGQADRWADRFSFASDGNRWRGELHTRSFRHGRPGVTKRGWTAGFDGKVHYYHNHRDGTFQIGLQESLEGASIQACFWSPRAKSILSSLGEGEWTATGQSIVHGFRCYDLERRRTYATGDQLEQLTISPRQFFLPVRYRLLHAGQLVMDHKLENLRQDASERWYPGRVVLDRPSLGQQQETTVKRYESEPELASERFSKRIPWGAFVQDFTKGLIYKMDPWLSEVSIFLRTMDWPAADFVPLAEIFSFVEPDRDGKLAPKLTVDRWVVGEPVSLADRRGKVTMIYFSTGSLLMPAPRWVQGLRELHRVYAPYGFEVVGVIAATEDDAGLRQRLEESRVPWPVAIDRAQPSGYGQTFNAYGLKTYMSPVLVDAQGKLRLVKQGTLTEQLRELLTQAGEEEVPIISTDFVDSLSDETIALLRQQWRRLVGEAEREYELVGNVTEAGKPVGNASLSATMYLELAGSVHSPNNTLRLTFPRYAQAKVDDQGHFRLPLCKGILEVTVTAEGFEAQQRRLILADDAHVEPWRVELQPSSNRDCGR